MDLGLAGKTAVVVGASSDVGRAAALLLAEEGTRLVLAGRKREALEDAAGQARALGAEAHVAPVDLTDPGGAHALTAQAIAAVGRIDLLANTAGPWPVKGMNPAFREPIYGDDEAWEEAFNGVFMSAVRLTREIMPLMQAQGSGAIVHTGSNSARYYKASTASFAAMKAALVHAVKNWARDGADKGVRVNAILPGWIRGDRVTARIDGIAKEQGKSFEQAESEMMGDHAGLFWTPRMGTPEEYAAAIVFLLSRRAGYINGALVPVDGGTAVW